MFIHSFIEEAALRQPDKLAIVHDQRRVSYSELLDGVNRLSTCLHLNGIRYGDRVALQLENCIEYIISYYATLRIGAVAAPLNPLLKPDGLQYLLNDLEPACIISSFKSERMLKAIALPMQNLKIVVMNKPRQYWGDLSVDTITFDEATSVSPENITPTGLIETDLASIIYTSGSTGKPKGVMLSHQNIVANTGSICTYLNLTDKDIQMVVLPFFYVMGKSLLNTHMAVGGTVIINNQFMYPANVLQQMIAEKVTSFSGVPSTYAYLLHRSPLARVKDKLNNLRYCSQAGGHMSKSMKLELRKVLPNHTKIVIMYGATEASARLTYLNPKYFDSKIDSIGKPIPNVTIRLVDNNGMDVPNGDEGELVASGDNIMIGYWKDPRSTAFALKDQGYYTGDIGYCDKDGFLYILRRKDGLLKVGGHRVNPMEIEDGLMGTEMIVETVVVGLPDKLLGNRLYALVVPKDKEFNITDFLGKCAAVLPNHKVPSEVLPVKALPKNANGKIDKEACRIIIDKNYGSHILNTKETDEVSQ